MRYNRKPSIQACTFSKEKSPGVSILRPLKGVDSNLRDNLTSSFGLEYPNYEILFSVANDDDPAVEVVQSLMAQYPLVDAKLVVGEASAGVNPKINNMVKSYQLSKYEIVWVMDSNISVTPHTLTRAVYHLLQPNVGLIHHVPFGVLPKSLGASVEQVYLNTSHVKMYTMISMLISCVIGKSNMFRKKELEAVGGLAHFGQFMSEDNLIGRTIWNNGHLHVVPGDVVFQSLGSEGVDHYFKRKARWTRIRKFTDLDGVLMEPFIECFVNGVLGAHGFHYFFDTPTGWFFLAHVAYWFLLDMTLSFSVDKRMFVENFPQFVLAWFVREVTALPLHLYACVGSKVEWRGKPYRLQSGGTVIPEEEFVGVVKSLCLGGRIVGNELVSRNRSLQAKVKLGLAAVTAGSMFAIAFLLDVILDFGTIKEAAPVRVSVFEKGVVDNRCTLMRSDAECLRKRKDSAVSVGNERTESIVGQRIKLWMRVVTFVVGKELLNPQTAAEGWKVMFEYVVRCYTSQQNFDMSLPSERLLSYSLSPYHIAIYAPAAVGLGCWIFMVFIGIGCILVSYIRYTFKPTPVSSTLSKSKAPGVSILRPLKGVDVNLVDNLTSSFLLKYPNYEILFSVADAHDPAVEVVINLIKHYPLVDARLIIGGYFV
ncbi:UNVERIFIED_CONTAM: hypothetical protein HDU68_012058 [Siphonaria sp. JEL0065]|nr:hypothetical protein HDU68_012058 [Siphonaria sp. JEL0065]